MKYSRESLVKALKCMLEEADEDDREHAFWKCINSMSSAQIIEQFPL